MAEVVSTSVTPLTVIGGLPAQEFTAHWDNFGHRFLKDVLGLRAANRMQRGGETGLRPARPLRWTQHDHRKLILFGAFS
jgi:hypothetical protein